MLSIFGWVFALTIFAVFQIGRGEKFLGYAVLAFAALSAIVLPISFPAKVIVRAEGRNLQLAQGSRLEMREVKDAVARALVGGSSS
jgi:4-amino-4-deoxy-L-arabinose transferase-like glycosyltransferase